ncbi:MAG: hypothetical protein JWQ41_2487 [Variovorax sp.]|nr:hypothetical protein [Variovorax sp.]
MKINRIQPTSHTASIPGDSKVRPNASPYVREVKIGAKAGVKTVKDGTPLSNSICDDIDEIVTDAADVILPGRAMEVKFGDAPMVLYRPDAGFSLVLQHPDDFANKRNNGLYLYREESGNSGMKFDMEDVTMEHPRINQLLAYKERLHQGMFEMRSAQNALRLQNANS